VRNNIIIPYGAALLLIAVGAMAVFYFSKGTIELHGQETGRKIERFTPFARSAHWANAIAFVSLAFSGFVIAFGKYLLLPIIGATLFGWLSYALKNAHNFSGPVFAVALVLLIIKYLVDNLPRAGDLRWLLKFGGLFGGEHVASHRFNAGEKGMFWWGVCFPGLLIVGSGFVLNELVPGLGDVRSEMQIAHMIHAVASVVAMVAIIGHIYMGSVGVKGAYDGMKTGYVDEAWAKEHHELWYDDIKAGKIPAQRSKTEPAAPLQAAVKA
jgi:formate dehydrogenase subunit gamma